MKYLVVFHWQWINAELLITFINELDEDIGGMLIKMIDDTKLGIKQLFWWQVQETKWI